MKRSKSLAKIAAAALVLSLTVTAGAVPPLRPEPVAAADTTKQEPPLSSTCKTPHLRSPDSSTFP